MKLTGRDAVAFFSRPDPQAAGVLLFGQDAMRVSLRRTDILEKLLGDGAEEEMRLTRLTGAELRSDPARLLDAVKAVGFFPGARGVLVEDATDGLTDLFKTALGDWAAGDTQVIATAKALPARSKLRKLFEGSKQAYAIGIYDNPPSRAEIEETLAKAGVRDVDRDGMGALEALARSLNPGEFRQLIEKVALYAMGRAITAEDVAAMAPGSTEAAVDDMLDAVAGAQPDRIGPLLVRLAQQGVNPVSLCLATERRFRALHLAASHPGGPDQGIAAMRPPVFGPQRDRLLNAARGWGVKRLDAALQLLVETDLTLRSSTRAPTMAVMERALIRLSMMPRQR